MARRGKAAPLQGKFFHRLNGSGLGGVCGRRVHPRPHLDARLIQQGPELGQGCTSGVHPARLGVVFHLFGETSDGCRSS